MGVDHPGLQMSFAELIRTIRRIARQTIQNASIGRAGIRFYDAGSATFEGGGGVRILGGGFIDGEGTFHWTGPWKFVSSTGGEIDGDVLLSGDFDLTGKLTTQGIRIEGGKIYVGTGSGQIIIDGATGKITAGNMIIDPAGGGSVEFPNAAVVEADGLGGVQMRQGANKVFVGPGLVSLQYGSRSISINASGQRMGGVPTTPASLANGAAVGCAWFDPAGQVYRVVDG